jgi:N-acetylmuramoyl-L-alanine amidase
MMNPFPGAFSYWTLSDGVKTEVANYPEGDDWYQQDGDGDGFNNAQEAQFGSDPYRLDSDLDGLPDLVEYQYSLAAVTAGTPLPYDPWNWDSNGNGFSDFDEFYQQIQAYNPVVNYASLTAGTFCSYSDADGDGIKNFEDSEPFNTDRDGDLLLNWNEVAGQMDDPYNGAGPPNSEPPPPTDPGVMIGGTWYPTGTVDSDGDGTPDHLDSFPYGSFWYQGIEYGGASSDRDIDGIPDPADPFPDGSYWYGATEYAAPLVDQDGDGIPDGLDPWPTIAGSYTYNGTEYPGLILDADNDGIPDGFDPTPNGEAPPPGQDPWNGMPHYNYNGVEYAGSWSDQDADGIPDAQDATPNGGYWYQNTEYAGAWTDQDADGIPDALDNWPDDKWNGAAHFTYQGVEYPGNMVDDRDLDGIPDAADAYPDDRTNCADTDGDGLSDYDETTQYGTDPAKTDSDDDRLSDSDELFRYHTNPLLVKTNPDQPYSDFYMVNMEDGDSDGIPNGIEQWYADQGLGMNPADPADARGDLDGDGYTNLQAWQNGWSLTSHTDTYDYDQDGILDVLEDAWNAAYPGMFDNHNFNDSVEDFDGDGLMNFEEIALGLNPGKANSRHASVYDVQEWAWRGLVVGGPVGLSFAGLGLNSSTQPDWQVMEDANLDGVPDGLQAFVTALNADATLVTLPQRAASGDYDGDGMLDYWEHTYNLDLRAAGDAQANPDGDSLINSLEYAHGRNPLVSDDPPTEIPPLDDPTATPHIVTTSLPDGIVNSGYNVGIVVSGGTSPYVFSVSSGSLPDGLFLDENGGIIGTPTTEMSSTFTVQVVDGSGLSASQALTLNILPDAAGGGGGTGGDPPPPPPLTITTTDAQMRAIIYRPFSVTLAASGGGSDSYNFSITDTSLLPAGLEFSADTNTIHGTPTATGSCSFTLTVSNNGVTDGSASVSKEFTLTVHDPLAFVSEEQLPGAVRDSAYLSGFEMSGGYGPYHFSLASGELPPGLMLAANGQITGTPSVSGSCTFSVHVTDTFGGSLDKTFTLGVGEPPQPLTITTYSLPSGGVGIGYSAGIGVSGGNGDYTFTGEGGIFSVSSTGGISGFPTEPGVYAVSVTVTDSAQNSTNATYVISIEAPALAVTSGDKQILKVGDTPEPVTVSVTGGGVGLAGVPVTMGTQSTTTDENGNATFLPPALMTEGVQTLAVNFPGGGATMLLAAVATGGLVSAGTIDGEGNAFLSAPADPKSSPYPITDASIEYRSISISSGTLEASSSTHYYVWNQGSPPGLSDISWGSSKSKSGTIWRTSDPGKSQQGAEDPPPSMNNLNWSSGLNSRAWLSTPPDGDNKRVSGFEGLDSGGGIPPEHFDFFTSGAMGKVKGYREEGWFQVRLKRDPSVTEKPEVTKSFLEVRTVSSDNTSPTTTYTVRTLTMNAGAMNSDPLTVVANHDKESVYLSGGVVELSPKTKDEDGNDIVGSEKPNYGKLLTPFVEVDPYINKTAHRELKVSIGSDLKDKKVTWTLVALPGTIPAAIRGQWEDSPTHKDRFEASTAYGANGFRKVSQSSGETTVGTDGYTAIRVNVPPIGFNQVRIKIQIEGTSTPIDLIDMEVPGVVVIDPGHGGTANLPGSSYNNATSPSGVLEKTMALNYGLAVRDALKAKRQEDKLNLKVFMTREVDENKSGAYRGNKARDNGADVIFIIHFNANDDGSTPHRARGTLEVYRTTNNVFAQEDTQLSSNIIDGMVAAMQPFDAAANHRARVGFDDKPAVSSDLNNGNTTEYHPVRTAYIEVEFIDFGANTTDKADDAVDVLLNTGPNAGAVKTAIANAIRDSILQDLRDQPQQQP